MEESHLLQRKVSNFENLLVLAIVGGTPRIMYGNAENVPFTLIDSREEQRVIIFDLDNDMVRRIVGQWSGGVINIERYKRVLFKLIAHQETGETLGHYLNEVRGLDEEQSLEPENQWELDQT